jgi:hypothetical protein
MQLQLTELNVGDLILVTCNESKAFTVTVPNITNEKLEAIYKIIGYENS